MAPLQSAKDSAAVFEAARQLVVEALRQTKYPVSLEETAVEALAPVFDAGRAIHENDGVAFADADDFHGMLIQQTAAATAAAWPDLDAAHEILDPFARLIILANVPETLWTRLVETLSADYGLDLLAVLRAAAEAPMSDDRPHPAVWTLYPPLAKALPDLDPDPSQLAQSLAPVLDAVGGDMMGGLMHGAVEQLAATSPARARHLVDAFLHTPECSSVRLAANALVGLGRVEPEEAHRRAFDLSLSDLIAVRHVGICALGWFPYEAEDSRLEATLDRFGEICATPADADDLPVTAQAVGTIAEAEEPGPLHLQARQALAELARKEGDRVSHVIAQIVARGSGNTPEAPWLRDLLDALASTPAAHKGTLRWVDHALSNVLKADPIWAISYFRRLIESRPYAREGDDDRIDDLVSMTVSAAVREHRPALQAEITRWLATERPDLQAAAGDLLAYGHVSDDATTPFRLEAAALTSLNAPARERVLFALLGHLPDHKRLAPLLVSLVSGPWATPRLRGLTVTALVDVALYDFPGSARRYLVRLAVREDTAPEAWPVVAEALTRSAAYYEAFDGLPRLKELLSPVHRLRRHAALQHDQTRDMRKRVHQESDLLSLFTTIPLKFGNAWFSEQDGHLEAPRHLGTSSYQFEVSRTLANDPLGFTMLRHEWRYRATLPDPAALDA